MHPAEFGKLAARHNLVEIAEGCAINLNLQDRNSVEEVRMRRGD